MDIALPPAHRRKNPIKWLNPGYQLQLEREK